MTVELESALPVVAWNFATEVHVEIRFLNPMLYFDVVFVLALMTMKETLCFHCVRDTS